MTLLKLKQTVRDSMPTPTQKAAEYLGVTLDSKNSRGKLRRIRAKAYKIKKSAKKAVRRLTRYILL